MLDSILETWWFDNNWEERHGELYYKGKRVREGEFGNIENTQKNIYWGKIPEGGNKIKRK